MKKKEAMPMGDTLGGDAAANSFSPAVALSISSIGLVRRTKHSLHGCGRDEKGVDGQNVNERHTARR